MRRPMQYQHADTSPLNLQLSPKIPACDTPLAMEYSCILSDSASDADLCRAFTSSLDAAAFALALTAASAHSLVSSKRSPAIARFFHTGLSLFARAPGLENCPAAAMDALASNGLLSSSGRNGSRTSFSTSPRKTSLSQRIFDDDDGDDITSLPQGSARRDSVQSITTVPEEDSHDLAAGIAPSVNTDLDNQAFKKADLSELIIEELVESDPALVDSNTVAQIATMFRIWFEVLRGLSATNKTDAFAKTFAISGTETAFTEQDLLTLLLYTKAYVDGAIAANDLLKAESLKELILLTHEILHCLFFAISVEQQSTKSNDALVIKRLLYALFRADLLCTFQLLLDLTTAKKYLKRLPKSHRPPEDSLRLSYSTVMKLHTIQVTLANCPLDFILVDKVSLSLDITTVKDTSPNVYANHLKGLNFLDRDISAHLESRMIPLLAAQFNYYYSLSPDLLKHNLEHSSFFGWITRNTLGSNLYLFIETTEEVTKSPEKSLDVKDPYMFEVEFYENTCRMQQNSGGNDSEDAVKAPAYLVNTFLLHSLVHNQTFLRRFTAPKYPPDGDADKDLKKMNLFDIWLCVSSYVHHYQYKSPVNKFGARVSFLLLLKLTSSKYGVLEQLREHYIDENKWKLCHHRNPLISLTGTNGFKPVLLYLLDLMQITLRFNLSKRMDLENSKLALTIIYQILSEFEETPCEEMNEYQWLDFYLSLISFIKFVVKNFNEVDIESVIEEVFSVMDLLLSPKYDVILKKNTDLFTLGRHLTKSINYDLLYIMLQHRESLENCFEKFITKTSNFQYVKKAFAAMKSRSEGKAELRPEEITNLINDLTIYNEDKADYKASIDLGEFNYAETFKYLDSFRSYEDFEKQTELLRIFALMFDHTWANTGKV